MTNRGRPPIYGSAFTNKMRTLTMIDKKAIAQEVDEIRYLHSTKTKWEITHDRWVKFTE